MTVAGVATEEGRERRKQTGLQLKKGELELFTLFVYTSVYIKKHYLCLPCMKTIILHIYF